MEAPVIGNNEVNRFARLFRGNLRTRGVYNSGLGRAETYHEEPLPEHYKEHLEGGLGLGIVPINDEHECWFGAIDLDQHEPGQEIDLVELEAKVRELDLPLTVCRSKSGGAHLYVFMSSPAPAKLMRRALASWSEQLGRAGCEIFPKQQSLDVDTDGERQRGNWINLPWYYYTDSERHTVEGGKRIRFEYFLELAESRCISPAELHERGSDAHAEAPPCLQKIMKDGAPHGQRNNALYNMVVYLKQAFPDNYRDMAHDMNIRVFDEPLAYSEAKKTIQSASRRDYRYKCKEEPIRSLCRCDTCVKRQFGITAEEKSQLQLGGDPAFQRIVMVRSDPVRFELYIDNHRLVMGEGEILDFRKVRERAMAIPMVLPQMKNDKWNAMLHALLEERDEIEAPEEASAKGIIRSHLESFIEKADLADPGTENDRRDDLLHGMPVVQYHEPSETRYVYFRGGDFVEYLRKQRAEEQKHANLWMTLREIGVVYTRIRVPSKKGPIQVWAIEVDQFDQPQFQQRDVAPEF